MFLHVFPQVVLLDESYIALFAFEIIFLNIGGDTFEVSSQIGPRVIFAGKSGLGILGHGKLGPRQIGTRQIRPRQMGPWQIGLRQIGPLENVGAAICRGPIFQGNGKLGPRK